MYKNRELYDKYATKHLKHTRKLLRNEIQCDINVKKKTATQD